jgi:hypothetical protein
VVDIIQTSDNPSVAPDEHKVAQPIVIRKLDRLETTKQSSPSGN